MEVEVGQRAEVRPSIPHFWICARSLIRLKFSPQSVLDTKDRSGTKGEGDTFCELHAQEYGLIPGRILEAMWRVQQCRGLAEGVVR
jgi:hypothetical protein